MFTTVTRKNWSRRAAWLSAAATAAVVSSGSGSGPLGVWRDTAEKTIEMQTLPSNGSIMELPSDLRVKVKAHYCGWVPENCDSGEAGGTALPVRGFGFTWVWETLQCSGPSLQKVSLRFRRAEVDGGNRVQILTLLYFQRHYSGTLF